MNSSAQCSPETTTTTGGLLASGPRSNSSSLSPDGNASTASSGAASGGVGGGLLPTQLHLLHQQQQRSFHIGEMSSPYSNSSGSGSGGVCSSSWLQQENDYFKELAELLQENLNRPEMLQGVNSQALRDMIRQLQQLKDTKKDNAIQHGDVSSSGPTLLASHIGPMLLEALDGFFFVMNTDGFVEFVSQNVQKYLKYSQAEMLNKPIYNFLAMGDHDLFTRLLPDSMGWNLLSMSSPANGRERRSHTFMCRFVVNSNNDMMNGKSHQESSLFENLQVSAISLPYPNIDVQREMDEFLSFTPISDSQPCLVCVARRLPDAGNGNTDQSAATRCNSQRSSSTISGSNGGKVCSATGSQEDVQFSIVCKSDTLEILSVDCKDNGFKLFLMSKDGQSGIAGRLRNLCHPSDLPILDSHIRNVLEHGSDCLSQLRMYCPPSMAAGGSTISPQASTSYLFLQARSRLLPNGNNEDKMLSPASPTPMQLDFTLLRVTEAASSSYTSPYLSSLAFPNNSTSSCAVFGQNSASSDASKLQQNQYGACSVALNSTVSSFSSCTKTEDGGRTLHTPQSTGGEFVSSSFGDIGQSHDTALNNASSPFDLFLDVDMQFDCLQPNGLTSSSSSTGSQQQQNFDSYFQNQHQNANRQLPSSTTLSPPDQQSHSMAKPGPNHHRHASGPRKGSTAAAVTPNARCPSALSEPVSSTACSGFQSGNNSQDELQRLCSIFLGSPGLDNNAGQLSSSASSPAANFLRSTPGQQQSAVSPYQQNQMVKSELISPSSCQRQNLQQHAAQYGDLNILKNLLAEEQQHRQQQRQPCYQQYQSQVQQDLKPSLHETMTYQSPSQGDAMNSIAFSGQSGAIFENGAAASAGTPVAGLDTPAPTGKAGKGKRAGKAAGNGGGGKKSKKAKHLELQQAAQQQGSSMEHSAKSEPTLHSCSGGVGDGRFGAARAIAGNQPHMQILQSLLQEEECSNGAQNGNSSNQPGVFARTTSIGNGPMFAGAQLSALDTSSIVSPYTATQTPTPNSRKRRGSSYSSTQSVEPPISSTTGSPPVASNTTASPAGVQGQQAPNASLGPPPAKQSTSLLVQLLEQAAPQTRTLPTSIASSPLDKLAKENKENPNKPRVSTVLVETLLTRPRTSTPTTGVAQQQHDIMHQATSGGPVFASHYAATPPMFMQAPGGPSGQAEYGSAGMVFQQQQYFQQQTFQQQHMLGQGPMYQQQPIDQHQMQFMESQQYGSMMAPGDTLHAPVMPAPGVSFPHQQQPIRPVRGHRQPGGANVRHQLLLQQQQKRGKHHPAPAPQQMPMGMFPVQHGASRPPPYPGLPPTSIPHGIPQAGPCSYQTVASFRPSLPHYSGSQSLPSTPTLPSNGQSSQQHVQQPPQQHVFSFDAPSRFPVSAMAPTTAPAGHTANGPPPQPQLGSPPGMVAPMYHARMPQPGSTGNCAPPQPIAPSDVVRHELRQAVQNRAQLQQQQQHHQTAMMAGQQQFQQQQSQLAAWHRSQSMPGSMDRGVSKDFGSPPGQTLLQTDRSPQQQQQLAAKGQMPPPYTNMGKGMTSMLQQHLLSPTSSSSCSNSGAPPTDPTPSLASAGSNGGGVNFENVDNGSQAAGGTANLEASWNFDLGFENGLDMDDESTRNFLQQLLN